MADCNIIKISDHWYMYYETGKTKQKRAWVARCPECKKIIHTPYNANSRKIAKDWLHYHMRSSHKN